jgi:hypothetical protein
MADAQKRETCTNDNLTAYEKGVYWAGIKLNNNVCLKIKWLPPSIKNFKTALKEFL